MTDPDRPSAEEVELPEELVQLCSRTYVKECPDTDLPDGMDSYIDVATVSYRLGLAHGGGRALREAAGDEQHIDSKYGDYMADMILAWATGFDVAPPSIAQCAELQRRLTRWLERRLRDRADAIEKE